MFNRLGPPLPSLTTLVYGLYQHISNHPLIVSPPIFHPIGGERMYINKYRLFNGLALEQGLTCSIFPYFQDSKILPEPSTSSASVIYMPESVGNDSHDLAIYHISVRFHFGNNILGNKVENEELVYVPSESVTHPDQILLTSSTRRAVDLYINPGSDIIGNYLELLRLVIEDRDLSKDLRESLRIKSMEMLYSNLRSTPWEQEKGIYFHTGEALIRFDSYLSRGWRDKFNVPISDLNIIDQEKGKKIYRRDEIQC